MAHQPTKPSTYVVIYVTLLLLTTTTVLIAINQDALGVGRLEIPIALGIAGTKTLLVALFFMHLLHSSKLTWLAMVLGLLFLGAMVVITLSDYWTRGWILSPSAASAIMPF
jgi:cytochrome c oxidase subunit 4